MEAMASKGLRGVPLAARKDAQHEDHPVKLTQDDHAGLVCARAPICQRPRLIRV
jgi:hypothetical protein